MTDATWAIQISPKLPDGTLINVRADTPDQLDVLLTYVQNKGADIASAVQALVAGGTVAGAFPGSGNVQPQGGFTPTPVEQGWSQQGSQQAPPAFAQPVPAGGQAPPPQCPHGAMVYREAKPGSGKTWKAWFCPTPQNTPGQCKPEFI